MQTIDEVKRHCRVAVAVAAVATAAVCCAAEPVVKELFPWFEIGETVDAAKLKGLKHLQTVKAREGLRPHEQYLIVDTKMPTNDMAWVTLSVPDRKVLQMRRDIGCGTIAAARKLAKELQAKFTPLKFEGGPKSLEIMKVADASVSVQLSDADFGKELNDWLKKVE